ncbi:membrane protein FAM174A-like [Stegostoma tigrinum]|uniref:membrane protein FAM174A-like n=1 Tax=Stegostoma tigrinum TaxID=3053191 RepID=UPI00287033F2|nr:membrane protein FAM174A-like [Stegostoma tigrinum]
MWSLGPRLLWLCPLMWAGDAVLDVKMSWNSLGSQTLLGLVPQNNNNNNSISNNGSTPGLEAGGKPAKDVEYNNSVSADEQTMMIQRALYVLVAVTALVIVYFVVRTIRVRRIHRKNRKYGILNTNLENMEMRPLDQEDDDEDDALFDVHQSRR